MIEGQPRHDHIPLDVEVGGVADRIDVGPDLGVGQHHTFRVGGGPAGELEDGERGGVDDGLVEVGGTRPTRSDRHLVEQDERRVRRVGIQEGGEVTVDERQTDVGAADPGPGLGDEVLHRSQPHRKGENDDGGAGQPGGLDGRDEPAGRGAQQGDPVTGADPTSLQVGCHRPGVLVHPSPAHALRFAGPDEGDVPASGRGSLDP